MAEIGSSRYSPEGRSSSCGLGIVFSLVAGLLISMQNVFNARVSERIGPLETTVVVHAVGLVVAVAIALVSGRGGWHSIGEVNRLYLLGGAFGVGIVYSIAKGVSLLGVSYSISILLISQLALAMVIDLLGLFGSPKTSMDMTKPIGLLVMVLGIVIFKLKG